MKFIAIHRLKLFENVNKILRIFGKIEKPTLKVFPDLSNFTWSKENLRKHTHCMHPILLGILVKISNLGRNQTHFVFHTKVQEFIVEFILGILNLRVLKLLFRSGDSDTDSQPQEPTQLTRMVWESPTKSHSTIISQDGFREDEPSHRFDWGRIYCRFDSHIRNHFLSKKF